MSLDAPCCVETVERRAVAALALKRCGALNVNPVAMHGMLKSQTGGMQAQARTSCDDFFWGIQRVTQHGVAYMGHMHPQLVRSPGDGLQPKLGATGGHARLVRVPLVTRLAGFAVKGIDNLQRPSLPVTYQGRVNQFPCGFFASLHVTMHDGGVALENFAARKGVSQFALHVLGAGQDQQA